MGSTRAALAICVFLSHLLAVGRLDPEAGEAAVTCFFVLSGYILAYVHEEKFVASASIASDSLRFYYLRWASLARPYALAVGGYLLLIVLQSVRSGTPYHPLNLYLSDVPHWNPLRQAAFLASNLALIGLNAFGWRSLIDPPTWTLGLEAVFWLIAVPLFRLRSTWLLLFGAAFLALDLMLSDARSPFLHFSYFVLGILVHRRRALWPAPWTSRAVDWRRTVMLALPVAVAALLLTNQRVLLYASPVVLAAVLPLLPKRAQAARLDAWLGDASYPFYLLHVPCINIGSALLHRQAGDPITPVFEGTAFALAAVLSLAMVRWVPKPDVGRLYRGWRAGPASPRG